MTWLTGIPMGVPLSEDFPAMISALGREEFGRSLLTMLHNLCRADHCALFRMEEGNPRAVLALSLDGSDLAARQGQLYQRHQFWRVDPTIEQVRSQAVRDVPVMARRRIDEYYNSEIRNLIFRPWNVVDRAVILGAPGDGALGVTISASEAMGAFDESSLVTLHNLAKPLLALAAKHIELGKPRMQYSSCLKSLDFIERLIAVSTADLTGRESQVCARIIYGLSAFAISSDLGVGEESVMTYRKRAYQKLGIATQRELMMWFIGLFEHSTMAS